MKKVILILGAAAALVLAGCNQGGTSDQYGTSSGSATSSNSVHNGANNNSNSNTTP
jgi:outer membrane lipoprotein SlyB